MTVSPPVTFFLHDAAEVCLCWGDVVVPVVPARLSAGAFSCVRVTADPSARLPTYVNHAADEVFHVLSGSFAITTGDADPVPLEVGSVAWVPRGRPRRLEVTGDSPGTVLVMVTPGDTLDDLLATLRRMPAADAAGSGIGAEVLARCGIEIVQV
jgi:mannose-6-phosphate isomerase-like protein (cupin superfamily)